MINYKVVFITKSKERIVLVDIYKLDCVKYKDTKLIECKHEL